MKKIYLLALSVLFLGGVFTSCEMKEELTGKKEVPTDTGSLELSLNIKEATTSRVSDVELVKDFPVSITNTDPELSSTNKEYSSYAEIEGQSLMFPVGEYTVEAHTAGEIQSRMTSPYYKGSSTLTIAKGVTSKADVSCKMLNTKIQMQYTDEFKETFTSWVITFDDSKNNTLVFTDDDENSVYYWYLGESGTSTIRMNIVAYTTNERGESVKVTDVKSFTKSDADISYDDDDDNFVGGDQLFITLNPEADTPEGGETEEPESKPQIGFDVNVDIVFTESGESGTIKVPVEGTDDSIGGSTDTDGEDDENSELPSMDIPSDITYSIDEDNQGIDMPSSADVLINIPAGLKSLNVKIVAGCSAFEEALNGLIGAYNLDFLTKGVEMVGNTNITQLFTKLGSTIECPNSGIHEYPFPVGAFFKFLNLTGPTDDGKSHQFIMKLEDMKGNIITGSLKITINQK